MCGISGFFNYAGVHIDGPEKLLRSMTGCLAHRGPDDEGIWKDEQAGIYLGHRRLSIIDLSPAGHQPMIAQNGNVIAFNGEIYNYKEIKEKLPKKNFFSSSDTEVMLDCYEAYGEDCLHHFNGMFAFALWDKEKQELFLARDRAGKKPIYYTVQNGIFAFASEIKSLFQLPWIKRELDERAFYYFLTFNQLPSPLTMFRNIFKLPPASKMRIGKNGKTDVQSYWEVSYQDYSSKNEQELEEIILTALEKSVKLRMVSDVPVGAFLSGGVDSSAIVALMSRYSSHPVKTYSIGFENAPRYDELEHARKVSKMFGTDHYEKIISPSDIKDFLPKVIDIFDEPLADSTSIPIYFISELAKKNGTIVVMTGDGPDELLLGYTNWMKYLNLHPYYQALYTLSPLLPKAIANLASEDSPQREIISRALNKQEMFWGGAKSFKENNKRLFLTESYSKRMEHVSAYEVILHYRELYDRIKKNKKDADYGDWMSYLGFKFLHPERYLFRADRLAMAHSVEGRMPFLDYEFVNIALSVPTAYKTRNRIPKYILKKTLEKVLPKEVLYRKKQGFNVPMREWAQEVMLEYVEDHYREFCKNWDLFDASMLQFQLNEIRKGNKNYVNNLWNIYFLISWFRKWL